MHLVHTLTDLRDHLSAYRHPAAPATDAGSDFLPRLEQARTDFRAVMDAKLD